MSNFSSPFIGWIVPHPWQEPIDASEDEEEIEEEDEDQSDYDPIGEFTL